jgi:glycerophosphoryl diester phosphodiesterase
MRRFAGGTLFVVWQPRRPGEMPLVIGHRGASARETENTVAAFRRARADGADGVELDVVLAATGEVMVFHDDDLVRLAGRPEAIGELPYRTLREVQLPGGTGIPTLEEALEACGPDLLVNVELKANQLEHARVAALVEAVAGVVEATGSGARVLVSSFNPWAVRLWTRRAPAVRAALLFERASMLPLRRAWLAPWLRPAALNPELVLCTPGRVAAWHRRGYLVNVWTVDDPAALAACRRMGVDGVITNDPARSRAALLASA